MTIPGASELGLDARVLLLIGAASGTAGAFVFGLVAGGSLGPASQEVSLALGAVILYLVVSTPKRMVEGEKSLQAKESAFVSLSATACRSVTGSRCLTILSMNSQEKEVSQAFREAGRLILLGEDPETAVDMASKRITSYSAKSAMLSAATISARTPATGGEEFSGLQNAMDLESEVKVPLFMTVCFFTPVLLVLAAVFGHDSGPQSTVELSGCGLLVLDAAYFATSSRKEP